MQIAYYCYFNVFQSFGMLLLLCVVTLIWGLVSATSVEKRQGKAKKIYPIWQGLFGTPASRMRVHALLKILFLIWFKS